MYERLLVAFDGTEASRRALCAGVDLAKRLGRPLRTITVLEDNVISIAAGGVEPESMVELRRSAERHAEELRKEIEAMGRDSGVEIQSEAVHGEEVEAIVEAVCRCHADVLIVGLRAHPGLVDRLFSHTTRDLRERSPCSILGVK